jgi:hypothetical protein
LGIKSRNYYALSIRLKAVQTDFFDVHPGSVSSAFALSKITPDAFYALTASANKFIDIFLQVSEVFVA